MKRFNVNTRVLYCLTRLFYSQPFACTGRHGMIFKAIFQVDFRTTSDAHNGKLQVAFSAPRILASNYFPLIYSRLELLLMTFEIIKRLFAGIAYI